MTRCTPDDYIFRMLKSGIPNLFFIFLINLTILFLIIQLSFLLLLRFSFLHKENLLGVYLLLLHTGTTVSFYQWYPLLLSVLFLFASYYFMAVTYRMEKPETYVFYSGMLFALSVFFSPLFIIFLPLMLVSFITYLVFSFRGFFAFMLGIIVSIMILFFLFKLSGTPEHIFFSSFVINILNIGIPSLSVNTSLPLIVLIVMLNISIFYLSKNETGVSVFMKKNRQMMLLWAFSGFLLFFSKCSSWTHLIIPACVPISLLLGEMFFSMKNEKMARRLFYLLVLNYILQVIQVFYFEFQKI